MHAAQPALSEYDVILVNSSAGKDSQAMLTYLVERADAEGVSRSRFIVVHADLGRVEWKGTRDLAAEQAAAYGLRFETVRREKGDLLTQVEQRRASNLAKAAAADAEGDTDEADRRRKMPSFPSSKARWCTSDQKTSQVQKLMTALADEHRARHGKHAVIRILNCLGIRAQESDARALKRPFLRDPATNSLRTVDRWHPILDWSEERVWSVIRESGLPYHPAYDAGMPRLSCCFCVLGTERQQVLAARLNPGLAAEYAAVEERVESRFTDARSMAQIIALAADPTYSTDRPTEAADQQLCLAF